MTIEVKCPNRSCDQQLALSPEMAGKKGKCPKCGKTFQIPQSLGKRKSQSGQQAASQKSAAAPGRQQDVISADELSAYIVDDDAAAQTVPAPRRRPRPAPTAEVIEDYEADVVAEDVAYQQPRPARRRADDYEDYDAEPYEPDDDVPRHAAKSGGGMSKTRRWKLGSVGFLIMAIAMCVMGGSYVFLFLSEAFAQLGMAAGSAPLGKAAGVFLKISQIVWLLADIAVVTAYAFCLFIPNKRATLGLTIAAVSVCVLNLIMGIIFRFVPIVSEHLIGSTPPLMRSIMAGWLGGAGTAGYEVSTLLIELGFVAEFMLLSLLLAEIARAQKDRHHKADCMRVVWFLTGLAGAMFVMSMFMFFVDAGDLTYRISRTGLELQSEKKWIFYIVRIFNWACNGLLTLSFVFLIMNLFHTRKATA